jgi:hypothetical protein
MSRIEISPASATRSMSAAIIATGTDCAAMAGTTSPQWGLSATSTVVSFAGPPTRTTSGRVATLPAWASLSLAKLLKLVGWPSTRKDDASAVLR